MGTLRFVTRCALLLLVLGVCLLLHGIWRALRRPSPWPRRFLGAVGRIAGARVRITGTPLRSGVVILSNHLSWIDILVLAGATGCAFVAKSEIAEVPLIGWLCGLNATVFVRREERMGIGRQVEQLRAAFATTPAVVLFPEGTTSDGTGLLPFKASLLAALDPPPPGIRVQPVRIDYGPDTRTLAWVDDEPGADHARRLLSRRGTFPVTLAFQEPFDPAPVGGRKAVAARAYAQIAAAAPA